MGFALKLMRQVSWILFRDHVVYYVEVGEVELILASVLCPHKLWELRPAVHSASVSLRGVVAF